MGLWRCLLIWSKRSLTLDQSFDPDSVDLSVAGILDSIYIQVDSKVPKHLQNVSFRDALDDYHHQIKFVLLGVVQCWRGYHKKYMVPGMVERLDDVQFCFGGQALDSKDWDRFIFDSGCDSTLLHCKLSGYVQESHMQELSRAHAGEEMEH